ncbi:hypothetical protein HS125_01610 [bacterium]|nr:hypothetical protein [bacterium]
MRRPLIHLVSMLALSCLSATPQSFGEDGVLLKNRFSPGERAEMTLVSEVTGTLSGQPIHYDFNLVLELSTERLLPDGGAEVAVELKSLSMKGEAQGQPIDQNWDVGRLESLGMKRSPLRATVSASGRVLSVTGDEQISQKILEWVDFSKYLVEG